MGFKVDNWDWATFAVLLLLLVVLLVGIVLVLGLPGRIAINRKHPDAEAVNMMGWLGFLALVPWIQAFMWAFKPTDVVDIRRYPVEEQERIREMIAKMRGGPPPPAPTEAAKTTEAPTEIVKTTVSPGDEPKG